LRRNGSDLANSSLEDIPQHIHTPATQINDEDSSEGKSNKRKRSRSSQYSREDDDGDAEFNPEDSLDKGTLSDDDYEEPSAKVRICFHAILHLPILMTTFLQQRAKKKVVHRAAAKKKANTSLSSSNGASAAAKKALKSKLPRDVPSPASSAPQTPAGLPPSPGGYPPYDAAVRSTFARSLSFVEGDLTLYLCTASLAWWTAQSNV